MALPFHSATQPINIRGIPIRVVAMAAAVFLLIPNPSANAQLYTATEITGLPYMFEIYGINNARTFVGSYTGSDTLLHAFSSTGGVTTDLGTIPGGGYFNTARAINNAGTIVGNAYGADSVPHAFSYSNGTMTDLGVLPGGHAGSIAFAVSASGIVAGWSSTAASYGGHAFAYASGTMTDLGTLGDPSVTSYATGVNDSGTVVGWSQTATSTEKHAFIYSGGTMTGLGNLGGPTDMSDSSDAVGINDAGTIGGDAGGQGPTNSIFSYSGGVMTNLGALSAYGATAVAMNSSGTIIGNGPASFAHPSCLVTVNGIVKDLNTLVDLPGVALQSVICMNDLGDIVALGESGGIYEYYLLSPIPGGSAPTPTPTPTPTPSPTPTPTPSPTPTPMPSARLVNISTRALVGIGGNILIPGFVIGGNGTEVLLIRADGPSLTAFGVSGALEQPSLMVTSQSSGSTIATNTGWGTNADPAKVVSTAAQVGAFALANGSADSAVIVTLQPGAYTVQVSGVGNTTGVALAEVYEVSYIGTARLINIATRAQVGTGGNILIPGFVIRGTGSEELLVRGDGPSLTAFGVTGALAQPSLTLTAQATGSTIGSNTGWGTNANPSQIASIAASVGAFSLASGSADSALVVNLQPGAYTMQISGVNNSTGVALAEVYEVP